MSDAPAQPDPHTRLAALEQAVAARTQDLSAALDQRAMLLHELDHRVKNNLQLIASLMLMQARRAADPAVKEALHGVLGRVNAIGAVHRRLFQSEDVGRFDLAEFIKDLMADLVSAARLPALKVECDLEPVAVTSEKAASVALLVNELLTNALRHAFPKGRPGRLAVTIVKKDGRVRIEIVDDGVGLGLDARSGGKGFGSSIVDLLGRQLQARVTREDALPGLRVVTELPVESVVYNAGASP